MVFSRKIPSLFRGLANPKQSPFPDKGDGLFHFETMNVHYEYRTKKAKVAIFQTRELALHWWNQLKNPAYAQALTLFKVATVTTEEIV